MTLRIVVTGVSGLLGANFAHLARERFEVIGLYGKNAISVPECACESADLTDRATTARTLDRRSPDAVVHLAAATDVERCEREPDWARAQNVDSTATLADWCRANGALMVYMSSDGVFGGTDSARFRGGYREEEAAKPVNRYARTKIEGENAVRGATSRHLIVRGSIYGWNAQPKKSLSEWGLAELRAGREVKGLSDVYFTPLSATSLSARVLRLMNGEARGTYHLSSSNAVSKYEFLRQLATAFDLPPDSVKPARSGEMTWSAPRPLDVTLNGGKAKAEFGLEPMTTAQDLADLRSLETCGYAASMKQWLG